MAFTKSFLTEKGLALAAKLIDSDAALTITRVLGGDGPEIPTPNSERSSLQNPAIAFETVEGVQYIAPDQIAIPVYYENSQLTTSLQLSEIGVFAEDPDDGEVLIAIATSYDAPLALPRLAEGRLELTCHFLLQLSLSPEINITLPSSTVYLTRNEADGRYWRLGVQYPATEIVESVGATVEAHQRWQDEQLKIVVDTLATGTRSALQVDFDSHQPLKWKIIDHNGWYDPANAVFRA